jgi:hypothetical protein
MADEKIIYCVVAETVQHPLSVEEYSIALPPEPYPVLLRTALVRIEETRTIVQVPGRLAAQAAHVVSKMRYTQLAHEVEAATVKTLTNRRRHLHTYDAPIVSPFQPITTIILGARDSFELEHVYRLLRDVAGILTYKFNDTNPAVYGEGEVTTAIATVPVLKAETIGILDYLPLWTPEQCQIGRWLLK